MEIEKLVAKWKEATSHREKALIEVRIWEYAGPDARRDTRRRDYVGKFVDDTTQAIHQRATIHNAEWAEALWERIDKDMPLSTACKLIADARKAGNRSGKFWDAFQKVLADYDKKPAIDIKRKDGKIIRRVSNGRPRKSVPSAQSTDTGPWDMIRKGALDIAKVHLDTLPSHTKSTLLKDFEVDLKVLVQRFKERVRMHARTMEGHDVASVPNAKVRSACLIFGIAPPSPGKPVDIKKAKKAQKRLVRVYHPDINPATRDQFEQVIEAYSVLERYMESI